MHKIFALMKWIDAGGTKGGGSLSLILFSSLLFSLCLIHNILHACEHFALHAIFSCNRTRILDRPHGRTSAGARVGCVSICSHVFECMKNSPIAGHSCSLAVPLHVMLAAILPKGVVAVVAVHYSLVKSWMPCSTTSSALLNS